MRFIYYFAFVFTVWALQDMLIDYPGKGQAWLYDTIIFTSVGLVVVAYGFILLLGWREKRNKPKYPSTVKARLQQGFRNGVNGGRG